MTPELNQTVTVQPDGRITLRDAGELPAAGQTFPELADSIKKAYSKILRDPVISVSPEVHENAPADVQRVSGYVLGSDDQIIIRGIQTPEISGKPDMPDEPVLIGTNGDITLPLIGHVKAGGLTVEQLEAELTARRTR
ncbi:MAG: polysaccharide biosynthesis/export family protein, partial [Candidatus Acidiferrales bacterium]